MNEANLAVLIDFENIAAGTEKEGLGRFKVEAVIDRVKDKGRILVARSYADWGRFARFKQALLQQNVTMMELTSHGMQDKNRADIAMVVDALELAFTRDYIDTFVVVSGDSDFTPLVLKMRELNKRVIGIGTRSSTSRLLIQACDEFIFYNSIVTKPDRERGRRATPSSNKRKSSERKAAFAKLVEALAGLQREVPDPPLASVVKGAILRRLPDFDESDLGFSSFGRFLEAAKKEGLVRLERDQKSGGYRVDSVDNSVPLETGDEEEVSEEWTDESMPDGVDEFVDHLARLKLDVCSHPVRMAILETTVDVVADRKKRKRRVNVQFVQQDVQKRIRKLHGEVPQPLVRGVFTAMMQAGLLYHRDGNPVRSGSAAFGLNDDADGLNKAMAAFYLDKLCRASLDLSDTAALAELFYGHVERSRDVEEFIAWHSVEGGEAEVFVPEDDDEDVDDEHTEETADSHSRGSRPSRESHVARTLPDDLDALLEVEDEEEEASEALDDLDALLGEVSEPAAEPEAPAAPAEEPAAEEVVEEKPKRKPRRKRVTKKAEPKDDLDSLLEEG